MNESIGALWRKEGKNGEYFSGNIEVNGEKINIVIFPNTKKEKETQPDLRILLSQKPAAPAKKDGIPF